MNKIMCQVNYSHLTLRDSNTDSENVNLIRHSVSDGQKTCSPKGVSLNYIYIIGVFTGKSYNKTIGT